MGERLLARKASSPENLSGRSCDKGPLRSCLGCREEETNKEKCL